MVAFRTKMVINGFPEDGCHVLRYAVLQVRFSITFLERETMDRSLADLPLPLASVPDMHNSQPRSCNFFMNLFR